MHYLHPAGPVQAAYVTPEISQEAIFTEHLRVHVCIPAHLAYDTG